MEGVRTRGIRDDWAIVADPSFIGTSLTISRRLQESTIIIIINQCLVNCI